MSKLEDSLAEEFRLFGVPAPLRQYKFHPERRFAIDFFWPEHRWLGLLVAVEINGGLYIRGRHNRGAQLEQEYEKIREAGRFGIFIFPFGPKDLYVPKSSGQGSKALRFMWRILQGDSEIPAPILTTVLPVQRPRRGKTMEMFT